MQVQAGIRTRQAERLPRRKFSSLRQRAIGAARARFKLNLELNHVMSLVARARTVERFSHARMTREVPPTIANAPRLPRSYVPTDHAVWRLLPALFVIKGGNVPNGNGFNCAFMSN